MPDPSTGSLGHAAVWRLRSRFQHFANDQRLQLRQGKDRWPRNPCSRAVLRRAFASGKVALEEPDRGVHRSARLGKDPILGYASREVVEHTKICWTDVGIYDLGVVQPKANFDLKGPF